MESKIITLHTVQQKTVTLLGLLNEYARKEIAEKKLSESTAGKYRYFILNIERYLAVTEQEDPDISSVRVKHMEEMRQWFQNNLHKHTNAHARKCSLGHASRHVELCKRAFSYAVTMDYIDVNRLREIKARRDKVKEVIHLEHHELGALKNAPPMHQNGISVEMVGWVIDLYIFQCYTGLSYADLYTYRVISRDGRLWIENERVKNGTHYYVPLFADALAIHEKYQARLPKITNQAYNRALQFIAEQLQIPKRLTSHTARKTFATQRDAEGWSTKTIADMMGNNLITLQKHYLAKSTRRIENELATLGY